MASPNTKMFVLGLVAGIAVSARELRHNGEEVAWYKQIHDIQDHLQELADDDDGLDELITVLRAHPATAKAVQMGIPDVSLRSPNFDVRFREMVGALKNEFELYEQTETEPRDGREERPIDGPRVANT